MDEKSSEALDEAGGALASEDQLIAATQPGGAIAAAKPDLGPSWTERATDLMRRHEGQPLSERIKDPQTLDLVAGFGGAGTFVRAEPAMAQAAERLAAQGASIGTIWQKLRVSMGADGIWRREINDAPAKFRAEMIPTSGGRISLDQVLEHPELYAAEPGLRNVTVEHRADPFFEGGFDRRTGRLYLGSLGAKKDVILHEVQHAIQKLQGMASGGAPEQFLNAAQQALVSGGIRPNRRQIYDVAYEMYKHVKGEIEARNVQKRLQELLYDIPPTETEEIPRGLQIDAVSNLRSASSGPYVKPEEVAQMRAMIAQGMSAREIAAKLGRSINTVKRFAPGSTAKGGSLPRFGPEEAKRFTEMVRAGKMSYSQIGKAFGISANAALGRAWRMGLMARRSGQTPSLPQLNLPPALSPEDILAGEGMFPAQED